MIYSVLYLELSLYNRHQLKNSMVQAPELRKFECKVNILKIFWSFAIFTALIAFSVQFYINEKEFNPDKDIIHWWSYYGRQL